ncbi:uncharacterized protein LOC8030287 isoform X2 [Ixodes scapularis]|uniref:uncharacterized protein LOC8030287 isoform X2 n=1 Tax=Ixodes scapularis TaxID=6945 RepID=UPI001A9D75C8|nr:uncharacterized protein LOC8030287 isoform X2 [Ixodes scapularis]
MKRSAAAMADASGDEEGPKAAGGECQEIVIDGATMLEAVEAIVSSEGSSTNMVIQDSATGQIFGQLQEGSHVGVIAQHMDITEPLTSLKSLLEQRLAVSLHDYAFFLQDTQELNASKNLVDQCVQGEGLVQVNVEIINKDGVRKINIVDVLKPAEEILTVSPNTVQQELIGEPPVVRKVVLPENEEPENVTRWIVSSEFKKEQEKHKIPAVSLLSHEKGAASPEPESEDSASPPAKCSRLPKETAQVIQIIRAGSSSSQSPAPPATDNFHWPRDAVVMLITHCQDEERKEGFHTFTKAFWSKISSELKDRGYSVNAKQIENKWKNLKKTYKAVKEGRREDHAGRDHSASSSSGRKTWAYFELMDSFYGRKSEQDFPMMITIPGGLRVMRPSKEIQEPESPGSSHGGVTLRSHKKRRLLQIEEYLEKKVKIEEGKLKQFTRFNDLFERFLEQADFD